jgi:hypothetical protein
MSTSGLSPHGFDLNDAGWFLHDLDPSSGRAGFVKTDRAALSAEPFLDHQWREAEAVDLRLAGLPAIGSETPRLNFIWHTSFCASTLLASCLDSPGRCLALKEPRALVLLADLKRGGYLDRSPSLARSVFGLLGRRFEADEQVLIKPSNGANTLIIEAAAQTQGRILLLHSDCESFVLSVARKGQAGFAYVRDLFRSLAADGHPLTRWPVDDLLRLTDLQLSALVWRMQMDMLEVASQRLGDRARSLDCRLFLEEPDLVLPRIDDFLGLGIGHRELEQAAAGALFSRDAKRPGQAYSAQGRADGQARVREHLGADLATAVRTMEAVFPNPPKLGHPLIAPDRAGAKRQGAPMREAAGAR